MDSGYSVVNEVSPAYTPDYESFIFNTPDHLSLQADQWINFYLIRKTSKKILAQVSFHNRNGEALSPLRAPFGSFLFSDKLSQLQRYEFIRHCEAQLIAKGVSTVTITEPPLFYRNGGELVQTFFFNLGYSVSRAELSSGIPVDSVNFGEKIAVLAKRKLKLAKSRGAVCKPIPLSELEHVYNFILKCRQERDYSLSMTFEELNATAKKFKKEFFLFGVFFQKELAAATICIRVHPTVLYNSYPAHLKKFNSTSPVVLLTEGIYKFCKSQHIQLLDLGTSSLDGQPNFGLLDFKLRLGAVPSMKLTFTKELK